MCEFVFPADAPSVSMSYCTGDSVSLYKHQPVGHKHCKLLGNLAVCITVLSEISAEALSTFAPVYLRRLLQKGANFGGAVNFFPDFIQPCSFLMPT